MAMKEYELTNVSEGVRDDEYYGGGKDNGLDAGQHSLMEGQLKSDEEKGGGEGEGEGGGAGGRTIWCGCLSIQFYKQFFQVDTKDVTERWLHSAVACKREKGFLELVEDNPDAYGPFWNSTSMIFLIALTTNLSSGGYDLTTLTTSTWVIYGFTAGAPLLLWVVLNQLDVPISLIKLICMYGYSIGPYLPAVLLCAVPIGLVSWAALGAAGVMSVIFLLRTLTPILLEKNMGMAAPVMAMLGMIQGVFTLILKFAFFD